MSRNLKFIDMLRGYAAAHRHPFNIFVHLLGIPTIMLGVLIPLTWVSSPLGPVDVSLAHLLVIGFFVYYLSLDRFFAVAFLLFALLLAELAAFIGMMPIETSGVIAIAAFAGGYLAQFIGHAVEKSMPVLVKHPIQAQLAAPFFTVVEMCKLVGLRHELFASIMAENDARADNRD